MNKKAREQNRVDIAIVGAGLAGISAAISAARCGVRVTLLEQEQVPGGTAIGLRHRYLCGLFANSAGRPRKYLNPGLTRELSEQISPQAQPVRMGKVWLLPINPRRVALTLANLLSCERNIQVLYGSKVTACYCREGRIESLQYVRKGKLHQLAAAAYIDAGAGILLHDCKALLPMNTLRRQMAGFSLELCGVTWDDVLPIRVPYVLYKAVTSGALPLYARWTTISAAEQKGQVYLKLSLPADAILSSARVVSRAIVKTLRRSLTAFDSAKVIWQSPAVFMRDGARLRGQYVLKVKDVLAGTQFSDGIMRGAWPVEFWDIKRGPTYKYPEDCSYELPLRCIAAKDVSNLFAAGRSVSAEPMAQASLRVGGLCIASGEAAGRGAIDLLRGEGRNR